ncbi:MAG TPA: TrbI/VirB10 family protein [Sedimentisphaerales bacterium]|nr:TrbI/VirB10 family protein [Sedimentisphaerales bacterium]
MKPRDFLNFFKTRSGKLVLFGVVFGGGLLVFSALRDKSGSDEIRVTGLTTNATDRPQVVQSIERQMQPFRPPPPKTNTPPPLPQKASEPPMVVVEKPKPEPPPQLPTISLFADASAGVPEPKTLGEIYAPFGRLIPCETVITVDSASIQTPIVGLITENIYHAGKLVIPAGTEVHGTAQTDRHRERIASGGSWTLVWQGGEELRLKAIALDREFSGDQEGWGITDGSAGLRGRIIKSDDLAEIKLFAATFLSGAADALTEKEQTIFGTVNSRSLNNAPFEGAQKVLSVYAQRIYEAIQRDGFYVRVPSGKQFYLYVLQTIDRSDAVIGGTLKPFAGEDKTNTPAFQPTAAFGVGHTPVPTAVAPQSTPMF